MKAGVVLEKWKLPIFKKHLDKAGFEYEERPGLLENCVTLHVQFDDVSELTPIIKAANLAAARSKMN